MSAARNGTDAPVLVTEHVKCRSLPSSNGRSPVGTLFVYDGRVVWRDENGADGLTVDFNIIRGQRVSPPNKSKTQLQLCLHDGHGEPATFAFVNPIGGQETHQKERDLVKDTLQQLLLKYRAVANAEAKKANHEQTKGSHMQQKERLLSENPRLQALYRDLVTTSLISPKEFWADYVDKPSDEASEQKVGVSGGFLSNVTKMDGCNGLKLNLTSDTIQAIFRTYPIVEQKHLELVPHEMTEQEFWRKFFQSHYFHRDRAANVNPTEVFADCLKADETDMKALVDAGVSLRNYDLNAVQDDLGLAGNEDADGQLKKGNANKALLVKRFNYHSGRVLKACLGDEAASSSSTVGSSLPQISSEKRVNGHVQPEPPSKRQKLDEFTYERVLLDSAELADDRNRQVGLPLNIDSFAQTTAETDTFSKESSLRLKKTVLRSLSLMKNNTEPVIGDVEAESAVSECIPGGHLWPIPSSNTLPRTVLNHLETLHFALAELLRHFWCCFPPKTPELEQKLERMMETLKKFEATKLTPSVQDIGTQNVVHLQSMLNNAYSRFESYRQRKDGQKQR